MLQFRLFYRTAQWIWFIFCLCLHSLLALRSKWSLCWRRESRAATLVSLKNKGLWVKAGDQCWSTGSLTSIYPALLTVMEKVPEGSSPVTLKSQRQKGNCSHIHTHMLISGGLPGLVCWHRWDVLATGASVSDGNRGLLHQRRPWVWPCMRLPFPHVHKQSPCLLFSYTHKKENFAALKALSREMCYLLPVQNTHNVFTSN